MNYPVFQWNNGDEFIPEQHALGDIPPVFGLDNEEGGDEGYAERLKSYIAYLWHEALEAKRAETERLKLCSLYYDGFHYTNAYLNRVNPVTNYCFSTVETVHPIMTEIRPRPEIVPRYGSWETHQIDDMNDVAQWFMDTAKFDEAIHLGARDKLKYGWNAWIISFDHASGMPFPKAISVFDVYPDATARNEDELEYLFVARPINTQKLRAMFPSIAEKIVSDNIASPAYDVHVTPFRNAIENAHRYEGPVGLEAVLPFRKESEAQPEGGTATTVSTGEYREHGSTTFVLQLIFRDSRKRAIQYFGTRHQIDPESGERIAHPAQTLNRTVPCSNSGWSIITMTANGEMLEEPRAVEECYLGLPIVFDFDYKQTDRFWPVGELDHVIPIQRKLNRRHQLLNRSLELAANPPVVTSRDSGLPADKSTVAAGEVLRITRGTELSVLEFRGPSQSQFEMLSVDQRDFDTVSGVHDVQQGQRPAGIEAAAAIRRLQEAAMTRVRGKENPAHRARALLLKKCLYAMTKKLKRQILYLASNGKTKPLPTDLMAGEYDYQFAPGSGTVNGRQDFEEKAFALFDRGAIDEMALLQAVGWRGAEEVAIRMVQRKLAEAAIAAKANAQGGPPRSKAA